MSDIINEVMNEKLDIPSEVSDKIGKPIKSVPKPEKPLSFDEKDDFWQTLINAATNDILDITKIDSFSQISQNREQLYQVLDAMATDPTIAAALEIYAEDTTAENTEHKVVWVSSEDDNVLKYVNYLLESLRVDKNIYRWAYSLIKYGDLYLKLFRESDFEDRLFKENEKTQLNEDFDKLQDIKEPVNEDVKIKAYASSDRLAGYVEMIPNPGEMFELVKFGKSYAYIKTNQPPTPQYGDVMTPNNQNHMMNGLYEFKRKDVDVYNATSFVHAALEEDVNRSPEKIRLFNDTEAEMDGDDISYTYNVRKGTSVLFNVYKIWRQLMLLENALLLNRLTKSSILRVIEVEVADMPKERVGPHLQRIKNLVEQKAAIDVGNSLQEYTNPGAMENNIYVPTHNGVGAIQTQQIGGDADVKDIADLDYFKNKLYSALKIPKTFLGDLDDGAGFNGGTSLSIVSSRYCKTIKRIQGTIVDMLTDLVNIFLLDRGLDNYIGQFDLMITPPTSQEEMDARDAKQAEIAMANDIISMVQNVVTDERAILRVTTSLLSDIISNDEVLSILNDIIEEGEQGADMGGDEDDLGGLGGGDFGGGDDFNFDLGGDDMGGDEMGPEPGEGGMDEGPDLPSPSDLGQDMTGM